MSEHTPRGLVAVVRHRGPEGYQRRFRGLIEMGRPELLRFATAVVVVLLTAQGAAWTQVQAQDHDQNELLRYEHQLRFRSAEDVMELVRPLLSPLGRVEVAEDGLSLVIVDGLAAQTRILPALATFDRPRRPVELVLQLARAELPGGVYSGDGEPADLALVEHLRRYLPYSDYHLVARAEVLAEEGKAVSVDLGKGFRVEFRIGSVLGNQRLRLHGFHVLRKRRNREDPLVQANLNLWLGRPMVVGLASSPESQRALMVIVESWAGSVEKTPVDDDQPRESQEIGPTVDESGRG